MASSYSKQCQGEKTTPLQGCAGFHIIVASLEERFPILAAYFVLCNNTLIRVCYHCHHLGRHTFPPLCSHDVLPLTLFCTRELVYLEPVSRLTVCVTVTCRQQVPTAEDFITFVMWLYVGLAFASKLPLNLQFSCYRSKCCQWVILLLTACYTFGRQINLYSLLERLLLQLKIMTLLLKYSSHKWVSLALNEHHLWAFPSRLGDLVV